MIIDEADSVRNSHEFRFEFRTTEQPRTGIPVPTLLSDRTTNRPGFSDLFTLLADDLATTERVLHDALASYRTPFGPLVEHLNHYRGKRLRPMLVLLAAEASGGINDDHHILGAVVEMIHTATLVHDDVLDAADTRRHVATVNAKWGNTVSILLGDMLFSKAFYLASQVDRRACEWIGDATNRVCAGELLQVTEKGNLDLSEQQYFAMIDGKTAALTEVCTRLGAAYAGASAEVIERFANFGRCLGQAFQIADDVLDLLGNEAQTGKTLGTDIEQQKLTLPLIHCLTELPTSHAEQLRERIRAGGHAAKSAVLAAIARTDSLEYTKRRAKGLAEQARAELACVMPSEAKEFLEVIVAWSIRREK